MSTNYKKQAPAFHGIKILKYAMRGSDNTKGTVVQLPYAKSISFDAQVDGEKVYANDRAVLTVVNDEGYTGDIGTTAPDIDFEKALGQIMETSGGLADLKLLGYKRADVYYEFSQMTEDGVNYIVKVWTFNVEVGKASKTHETDENTPKIGEYQYPITVYGEELQTAAKKAYEDENGNRVTVLRLMSYPGDDNYATFGDTVPTPTATTTNVAGD